VGLVGFAVWAYILTYSDRYLAPGSGTASILAYFVAPLTIAVISATTFRLKGNCRLLAQLCFATAILGCYLAEGWLFFLNVSATVRSDPRSKLEVISDLREDGRAAFPLFGFRASPELDIAGSQIIPVSNVPNVLTVQCNESGEWVTYNSDRFGFRNNDAIWDKTGHILYALGDSFTAGHCVPVGKSFVELIGAHQTTIGLGNGGNGPLSNLASYREYAVYRKPQAPRSVVWFHYANDLGLDIAYELMKPHLPKYLDAQFSQNLLAKAQAIRKALTSEIEGGPKFFHVQRNPETRMDLALSILKLSRLRFRLELTGGGGEWTPPPIDKFSEALRLVRDDVRKGGGTFLFVYLPSYTDLTWPDHNKNYITERGIAAVKKLGIKVLDLRPTFLKLDDPLSVFPGRRAIHYNEFGHALVATAVLRLLQP